MNGVDPLVQPDRMMDLHAAARATGGRVEGAAASFGGVTTDSRAPRTS